MSLGRWTATTLTMAVIAWGLGLLGPAADQVVRAVTAPQELVDTAGPDALLVPVAAAAGWLCWGWGVLGLLLTGLSAAPGVAGRTAGRALVVLLPAGARRLAAVAVGLALTGTGPALVLPASVVGDGLLVPAATDRPADGPPAAATGSGGAPPDWPGMPAEPGPGLPSPTDRVVLRGDCLWDIAADWLAAGRPGGAAGDAEVVAAVRAWWQVNEAVIGPDPDLLLPGQVLTPPAGPAGGPR